MTTKTPVRDGASVRLDLLSYSFLDEPAGNEQRKNDQFEDDHEELEGI